MDTHTLLSARLTNSLQFSGSARWASERKEMSMTAVVQVLMAIAMFSVAGLNFWLSARSRMNALLLGLGVFLASAFLLNAYQSRCDE